ncbi:unnamed protein product [Darwinula stevensoni]|uniref:TIR domain-containing protein n=1 Tax=Darwinula stevensoni TaxID=69355 RepID=A0A7R9A8T7_9CRUS|nr:unnamed protein product [Darwinula stevensoni]CAG0896713.1 unnamed protein product [Darwinula stevensoni]
MAQPMLKMSGSIPWFLFFIAMVVEGSCPSNCDCGAGGDGSQVFYCPRASLSPIILHFSPGSLLSIQCPQKMSPMNYNLLHGLHLGPVKTAELRFCPIPSNLPSYSGLFGVLGVDDVKVLVLEFMTDMQVTLAQEHFTGLTSLRALLLQGQGIIGLKPSMFEALKDLRSLTMEGTMVQDSFSEDLFSPLSNISMLQLGSNDISHLPERIFFENIQLRRLNLENNNLSQVSPRIFQTLNSLEVLELQSNQLSTFPHDIFWNLTSLHYLGLGLNQISTLDVDIFAYKPKLEALKLFGNPRLQELPGKIFHKLMSLKQLYLHLNALKDLPHDLFQELTSLENLTLNDNQIEVLLQDQFRGLKKLRNLDLKGNRVLIISSVIVSIAILSTGTVFVYYRYWKVLRLWFFVHGYCSCILLEEELDQDRTYDAFISYAQEDEAFVVGELRPHLEDKEPHFSLLLHFRNWLPGAQIHDNVINSISASKRTLVILSSAYVASPWCQSEFRLAFNHQIETQMNRLIVIVMGELPPDLPEEMQLYVSQNTYIRYGEPCFWEKLQYALPHYKQQKTINQNHRDDGIQLVDAPL